MSQHNIVGSEAFDRSPYVLIRGVRPSGRRRQRPRRLLAAMILVGGVASLGGAVAALALTGLI